MKFDKMSNKYVKLEIPETNDTSKNNNNALNNDKLHLQSVNIVFTSSTKCSQNTRKKLGIILMALIISGYIICLPLVAYRIIHRVDKQLDEKWKLENIIPDSVIQEKVMEIPDIPDHSEWMTLEKDRDSVLEKVNKTRQDLKGVIQQLENPDNYNRMYYDNFENSTMERNIKNNDDMKDVIKKLELVMQKKRVSAQKLKNLN